ncbi:MAG TPA: lasso RiPP family leader peptide-containing protein [Labilithrix sp.]|jgi:hypothetical protein|nr:lasso RiPP family leader peptide-containing protein [Labilithrix sp.]
MGPKAESSNPAASEGASTRRPYRAPRLRQLGSVRELTLGGTMGLPEGGGTLIMTTKM